MVTVESKRHRTGIVYHDIDGTKLANSLCGKRLHIGVAGDIRSLRDALPACICDVRDGLVQSLFINVCADDSGAERCALLADQLTETPACTCNDYDSVPYGLVHVFVLCFVGI